MLSVEYCLEHRSDCLFRQTAPAAGDLARLFDGAFKQPALELDHGGIF